MSKELNAAQDAVGWQRSYKYRDGSNGPWCSITKESYDETISGKWAHKYDVRELYAAPVAAAPGIGREQFRALVEACEDMRAASEECDIGEGLAHAVPFHLWNEFLSKLDASQQVIDASPKGEQSGNSGELER